MNTAIPQKNLEEMLDRAVREVTKQAAGVCLFQGGGELSEDLCSVHISFNRGFHTSLTLCADTALLTRMAQNALEEETPTTQDLEDFCKEYFNILCGKIAAILFRYTKIPARFSVPEFYRGRYTPEEHQMQFVLTYADGNQQSAHLTHYVPQGGENNGSAAK